MGLGGNSLSNLTIENNTISNCGQSGIDILGGSNLQIADNIISNIPLAYGILMENNGAYSGVNIKGNKISTVFDGIYLPPTATHATITNNLIQTVKPNGDGVNSRGGYNTISNNIITSDPNNTGYNTGIRSTTGDNITNNSIKGFYHGIIPFGSTAIIDNHINSFIGIDEGQSATNNIVGNSILSKYIPIRFYRGGK
jgi:parallel beta-helix repeat protein